jgi:hypothetical protein
LTAATSIRARWADCRARWRWSHTPSKPESKARHIQAIYTFNPAGKEAAQKAGRTPLTFHALTPDGNERFHDAITAAEVA